MCSPCAASIKQRAADQAKMQADPPGCGALFQGQLRQLGRLFALEHRQSAETSAQMSPPGVVTYGDAARPTTFRLRSNAVSCKPGLMAARQTTKHNNL